MKIKRKSLKTKDGMAWQPMTIFCDDVDALKDIMRDSHDEHAKYWLEMLEEAERHGTAEDDSPWKY